MRLPFLLLLMAAAACCAPYFMSGFFVAPWLKKCNRPGVISKADLDVELPLYDNQWAEAKVTDRFIECGKDDFVAFMDNNNKMQFTDEKIQCALGRWYVAYQEDSFENTKVCCKGKTLRKKQEPEKPKGCKRPGMIAPTELAKLSRDGLNYKFSNATVTKTTVECSSPTPTIVYTVADRHGQKVMRTTYTMVCEGDEWYVAGPEDRLEETNVACLGFATDENH